MIISILCFFTVFYFLDTNVYESKKNCVKSEMLTKKLAYII